MRRVAAFALLAAILGGCSLLGIGRAPRTLPPPQPAQIEISNQTTLDVDLFVNGSQVASVPGRTSKLLTARELPTMPWSVEARTIKGRVLGAFATTESDLLPTRGEHGGVGWTIPGTGVDLSCGRLRIFVGDHPPSGPPPGPGTPGDCEP
jgi:hypothetical protein